MNFIKEKLKNISNKKYDIYKAFIILAFLALFSVIFQAIVQNITSDYWVQNYLGYLKAPLLIVFNFLPFFLLTLLFYFLLNSISKSFVIVNMVSTLLLIINHYKIFFRDTPLKLNDFFIGREALNIVQNYKLEFNFQLFISAFLMLFLFILLIKFLHNEKNKLKIRILGTIITTFLIILSYFSIYQNTTLYENISKPANEFYDVDVVNSKGLIYSLLSQKTIQKTYQKPENYSVQAVNDLIETYTNETSSQKKYPNIIAIMSEAFFDPQTASNLEFYKNPLTNFNRLKKDAYYGNIIVPGFAGATASTEFEFLTGINVSNIDSTMPDVYKTHINSKTYSLIDIFKNLNYKTLAIHPGFSWFYNRNIVYKYMGFDNMIFKSDLPNDVPKVNYYISDNVTADLIIDNYSKHLEESPDQGYFNFTVTIQNHGPYSTTPNDNTFIEKPDNMDDELYTVLNNYIAGLNDADKLLGKVTDFVSTLDEPTVVLFFGDHLPYLDSELKAYEDIGYPIYENTVESLKLKYSTPYIIWGNNAAKELMSNDGGKILNGKSEDISSNYLGLKLLQYINMDLPPFFNFLNNVKNRVQIISKDYYYINNEFKFELNDDQKSLIDNYKIWSYYNLMGQK